MSVIFFLKNKFYKKGAGKDFKKNSSTRLSGPFLKIPSPNQTNKKIKVLVVFFKKIRFD